MLCEEFTGDIEQLRPLAEMWTKEANGTEFGLEIDVDAHLLDLKNLIEGLDSVLLVVKNATEICGYIGVIRFVSPLSKQFIGNEHYWFVHPEFRQGGLPAIMLVHAAKQWARERKCSHLIMNASNLASNMHDKLCDLYERLKMKKFETSYICRCDNGVL
jgi:GNAT superfamily N-acetyltransferase